MNVIIAFFVLFLIFKVISLIEDEKIRSLEKRKKDKRERANFYKEQYPNAFSQLLLELTHFNYQEYDYLINHIESIDGYILDAITDISDLEFKKKEELFKYNQQRQKEIDYNRLLAKYPNGIRLYTQVHPQSSSSAIDSIIAIPEKSLEEFEKQFQLSLFYSCWSIAQKNYSAILFKESTIHLNDWGKIIHSIGIKGYDELGKDKEFFFGIRHFFIRSYCSSDSVDYSFFPRLKKNHEALLRFLNRERVFKPSIYQDIILFLESIRDNILVVFADSGLGNNWELIEDYHFGRLKESLQVNCIPFVSIVHLDKNIVPNEGHIIVIEFTSNQTRLINNCSFLLNNYCDKKLTIAYMSLFREISENDVIILNDKEKENREQKKKEEMLHIVSHERKINSEAFISYLSNNNIHYFFHFTDRRNLDSIKEKGGLYSWKYCIENNIDIPYPGGDNTSRSLDVKHGLSDYVRLSLCDDHPMQWRLEEEGADIVLLRVKIDVAGLEGTLFSDINATDNSHHHGGSLEDLKRIDIPATQENYVSRESPIFKKHQAEVLVKTFIPLEYIIFPQ